MRYNLKYISMLLLGLAIGNTFCYLNHGSIPLEPATEIYKEVAHIPPDRYTNATLLFVDTANDIAYYRADERLQSVAEGDAVSLETGEVLHIKAADLRGFYLNTNTATIRAGISGTPVWREDEIIGYVSQLQNDDTLYCIWSN